MKSLSEQIRELEERAEQLERERDAQIALSREMLMNESRYAARREEFLHLQAQAAAAAAAEDSTFKIHGRTVVDVTPAMIRGVNWN